MTNCSRCSVHKLHALDSTNDEKITNECEQRVQGHKHQGASERAATGLDDVTDRDGRGDSGDVAERVEQPRVEAGCLPRR